MLGYRGQGKGEMCVCVCLCCREIGEECLSVCVFVLYLFVNAHSDTADPLWQGLCYSTEELC